jgi:hypothetical protein
VLPPAAQLRKEAAILRQIAPDDPKIAAAVNAFLTLDEIIAGGYTVRVGAPDEPKRAPLLPEWGGKEPPENP